MKDPRPTNLTAPTLTLTLIFTLALTLINDFRLRAVALSYGKMDMPQLGHASSMLYPVQFRRSGVRVVSGTEPSLKKGRLLFSFSDTIS